jgi:hypothetical protein
MNDKVRNLLLESITITEEARSSPNFKPKVCKDKMEVNVKGDDELPKCVSKRSLSIFAPKVRKLTDDD